MNYIVKNLVIIVWLFVSIKGTAQEHFFNEIFDQYPSDSIIAEYKMNKKLLNKIHADSTVKKSFLIDTSSFKGLVNIYVSSYQRYNENIDHFKCIVDIELYYENDSSLISAYNRLINRIDISGRKISIASTKNFPGRSYGIVGNAYKLEREYIVGIITYAERVPSDTGERSPRRVSALILRKEIILE